MNINFFKTEYSGINKKGTQNKSEKTEQLFEGISTECNSTPFFVSSEYALANKIGFTSDKKIKKLLSDMYGSLKKLPCERIDPLNEKVLESGKDYVVDKNTNPEIVIQKEEIELNKLRLENGRTYILGRDRQLSDILIDKPPVSRSHLSVQPFDDYYIIRDLNSLNGTKIKSGWHILNPDELCKVKGNNGKPVAQNYIMNSELVRWEILNGIYNNLSTRSTDDYVTVLNMAHAMAVCGNDLYYQKDGVLLSSSDLKMGTQRTGGPVHNARFEEAQKVEEIAKKYSDKYRATTPLQKVYLDGIDDYALPYDVYAQGFYSHMYPAGDFLYQYNEQLYRTHCDIIQEIKNGNSTGKPDYLSLLKKIAYHYQYGANARPYVQINNSLFMNEVNTYLQLAGMRKMTHGEYLDHAAQRMQPKAFAKYFVDYYLENQIS